MGDKPVTGLSTNREGQGFAISINGPLICVNDKGSSETRALNDSPRLYIRTFQRKEKEQRFGFEAGLARIFPANGQPKNKDRNYQCNEVVFADHAVKGTAGEMGLFQTEVELANGERYAVAIAIATHTPPIDWKPQP